eukprot:14432991-Alexandrium_andersonii.AAC.2
MGRALASGPVRGNSCLSCFRSGHERTVRARSFQKRKTQIASNSPRMCCLADCARCREVNTGKSTSQRVDLLT